MRVIKHKIAVVSGKGGLQARLRPPFLVQLTVLFVLQALASRVSLRC
jgi:hypothetical protein